MNNRSRIILGAVIAGLGVLLLLGHLLDLDLGQFCWPVGLMVVGAAILLRSRTLPSGTEHTLLPFGDLRRRGAWQVHDEEIWMLVGDARFDLSEANVPEGETTIRLYGLVGDVDVVAPPSVAVRIASTAFLNDLRVPGRKEDLFLTTARWASASAEAESSTRRVSFEIGALIVDLDVKEP
jgi:hypothetical protein